MTVLENKVLEREVVKCCRQKIINSAYVYDIIIRSPFGEYNKFLKLILFSKPQPSSKSKPWSPNPKSKIHSLLATLWYRNFPVPSFAVPLFLATPKLELNEYKLELNEFKAKNVAK